MEPVQFSTNQSPHISLNTHLLSEAESGKALRFVEKCSRHRNIPGSIQAEHYLQHF